MSSTQAPQSLITPEGSKVLNFALHTSRAELWGLTAPPSLLPLGLTFLQHNGLAQLLRADGEILLLTRGDDGLQVIVAFLQGSRATECGGLTHPGRPGAQHRARAAPSTHRAGRAAPAAEQQSPPALPAAPCLAHLDGIPAFLLGLGVRPAPLVLVGLLGGLLSAVTVLIVCGDTVGLGVGTEAPRGAQNSSREHTAAARPNIVPAPFNYSRLGRKAFQGALATLSVSSGSW